MRTNSRFLSRSVSHPKHETYRDTLVWQWLHAVKIGSGDVGYVIRKLRKRIDMPHMFPHKTYMAQFMRRAGVEQPMVDEVINHVWNMYAQWRDDRLRGNPQ